MAEPHRYQKGHKPYSKGGAREGAGRKSDAFKWVMQDIADSPKFIKWMQGIVDGEIEVDAETRLKYWREARDSGHGKPMQQITHSGTIQHELAEEEKKFIRDSIQEFICKP